MNRFLYVLGVCILLLLSSCSERVEQESSQQRNGVSADRILIGSSSALTGHAGLLGSQYLRGALSYIKHVNELGGVHGRQIQIIRLDDQYNPVKTVANTQNLIHEEEVFALFNYVGTPTSLAIKPVVENAKIPILGFFSGAESLRRPSSPYIFHLRDSYYAEAEGAVSYYVDTLGLKKIGVFYQEDAFGVAVLTGIQKALLKRGLEPAVTDTYIRGTLDIEGSCARINLENVDVIMMVGTYSPLAKFIKLTHRQQKYPLFYSVSFVGAEAFAQELVDNYAIEKEHYDDVVVTQVVPSPLTEKFNIANEYRLLSQKYFPDDKPNYVAFEGFLNARLLVVGLQNAGADLTRTGFIEGLYKIQNYNLGIDKEINYSPSDQEGIEGVYYSRLHPSGRFLSFEK